MLLSMETDNTWKPLGAVAGRIAAKLIAARKEIENPAARRPKPTDGGSVQTGTRRNRNSVASANAGEDRAPHPSGWKSGGRLDDVGRKAAPSGSVRHRGETPRTTGNVIHWLAHAPLRDAWSGGRKPRHDRRSAQTLPRRIARTCDASSE